MNALLTICQRKAVTHLHQERYQVVYDGLLQFAFSIIRSVLESQKLSHHGKLGVNFASRACETYKLYSNP